MPIRGRFITLEGIEGSGKSTLAARIAAAFAERGRPLVSTREPGGTDVGTRLRAILLDPSSSMDPRVELLLYCADRAEHVARLIEPALAGGLDVLCDRFTDATRSYQGIARGLGLELVDSVNLGHLQPNLTLLLDLPIEIGLNRARTRNLSGSQQHEGRFEGEQVAFHRAVRNGYLALARREPERIQVIDGDRPVDLVLSDALELIDRLPSPSDGSGVEAGA